MTDKRETGKPILWSVVTVAAFVVAIAILSNLPNKPVAGTYIGKVVETGANVALALLVVTLFVERGLAVINSLIWGEAERQAELDRMSKISDEQKAGETKLAAVMTMKERLRLLLGFAAGVFVSFAGVRTLGHLMTMPAKSETVFFTVDVILTAGLIAGGSNGLYFLVQLLKDLATKNKDEPKPGLRARLATTS